MDYASIVVHNPYNRDGNDMTNKEDKKFCSSCNNKDIDFTNWEIEEIEQY